MTNQEAFDRIATFIIYCAFIVCGMVMAYHFNYPNTFEVVKIQRLNKEDDKKIWIQEGFFFVKEHLVIENSPNKEQKDVRVFTWYPENQELDWRERDAVKTAISTFEFKNKYAD